MISTATQKIGLWSPFIVKVRCQGRGRWNWVWPMIWSKSVVVFVLMFLGSFVFNVCVVGDKHPKRPVKPTDTWVEWVD